MMVEMNAILEVQLNVYAVKGEVWVKSVPKWPQSYMTCEGDARVSDIDGALYEMKYWHRDYFRMREKECTDSKKELNIDSCPSYDNHGVWTLLTDCYCGGCGLARSNQLCDYKYNIQVVNYQGGGITWLTLTHETGHMLGAYGHTDDGIMYPYTPHDGIADGTLQFMKDNNERQMCKGLLHAMRKTDGDPGYNGVNGCFSVKDEGMINYRWKSSGEYGDCFPPCGKYRFKQFESFYFHPFALFLSKTEQKTRVAQ